MLTQENLLWLKNTSMENFNELMTAVCKEMTVTQRDRFIQDLMWNIAIMRHS